MRLQLTIDVTSEAKLFWKFMVVAVFVGQRLSTVQPVFLVLVFQLSMQQNRTLTTPLGRTPKGAYSPKGRSRHLLETPFSEPLLRTLIRTLFYCKTHSGPPSQNPSQNPSPEPSQKPS